MIGDILNAVMQECRKFLTDAGGTVILKTDYRASKLPTYTMPLLLVDLLEAPDSLQYPGGIERVDWNFALNIYNYMPDGTIDDTTGYSRNLLDVIDDIRRHFSIGIWLNTSIIPTMVDIETKYNFKFTLSGIVPADALENEDGLIMGYRIVFDSVGLDDGTNLVSKSTMPLAEVDQVNNPPFD